MRNEAILINKIVSGRCSHLPDFAAHVDMCRAQIAPKNVIGGSSDPPHPGRSEDLPGTIFINIRIEAIFREVHLISIVGAGLAPALVESWATARVAPTNNKKIQK